MQFTKHAISWDMKPAQNMTNRNERNDHKESTVATAIHMSTQMQHEYNQKKSETCNTTEPPPLPP